MPTSSTLADLMAAREQLVPPPVLFEPEDGEPEEGLDAAETQQVFRALESRDALISKLLEELTPQSPRDAWGAWVACRAALFEVCGTNFDAYEKREPPQWLVHNLAERVKALAIALSAYRNMTRG